MYKLKIICYNLSYKVRKGNFYEKMERRKGGRKYGLFWSCWRNNCCIRDYGIVLNVKIFVFAFIIYLINQIILKKTIYTFFKYYFNDLLAPILLLSFSNFLLQFYNKELKGKNIYIFIGFCSIFWEFITPLYKKSSVCDILDIVMYLIGASLYIILKFIIIRREKNGKQN